MPYGTYAGVYVSHKKRVLPSLLPAQRLYDVTNLGRSLH